MGIGLAIEEAVDDLLENYISSRSADLCAQLLPVALTGGCIYIMLMGYSIARGDTNETLPTFLRKAMRICFIAGIALSGGTYQTMAIDGSEALVSALLHSLSGFESVGSLIDDIAKPFSELGQQLWSESVVGIVPNFGLAAAAAIVAIGEFLLIAIGLGFYLLAKVALAVLLAIGPAFVLCAMWPATEKYTESWIGQVVNYVVLKVLIGATILLVTDFASKFAAHINVNTDAINVVKATLALLLCCGAAAVVMLNLPQIASALAGGASLSGIGRSIGRVFIDMLKKGDNNKPTPPSPGGQIRPVGARGAGREQKAGAALEPRKPLYQRNTIAKIRNK